MLLLRPRTSVWSKQQLVVIGHHVLVRKLVLRWRMLSIDSFSCALGSRRRALSPGLRLFLASPAHVPRVLPVAGRPWRLACQLDELEGHRSSNPAFESRTRIQTRGTAFEVDGSSIQTVDRAFECWIPHLNAGSEWWICPQMLDRAFKSRIQKMTSLSGRLARIEDSQKKHRGFATKNHGFAKKNPGFTKNNHCKK